MIKKSFFFLALFTILSFASINLTLYYGEGCPHCERTTQTLFKLSNIYNLSIVGKEVYSIPSNNQEMLEAYLRFGMDPSKGGVPTTLVEDRTLVIGEITKERWQEILSACRDSGCKEGVYTQDSFSESGSIESALFGAAIVDSINMFKIALIILPLGVLILSKGMKQIVWSGIIFSAVLGVVFILFSLGIMHSSLDLQLTTSFIFFVIIAALVLSILEVHVFFTKKDLLRREIPNFFLLVALIAIPSGYFLLPPASGFSMLMLSALNGSKISNGVSLSLLFTLVSFVPSFLITMAIYLGKANAESAKKDKEPSAYMVHLVSGLVLFALFMIMLVQMFGA